jgi:hypothetical protein
MEGAERDDGGDFGGQEITPERKGGLCGEWEEAEWRRRMNVARWGKDVGGATMAN